MYVDLHIHSYYSDGTLAPEEIITQAKAKGLEKIAITDHNEIKGMLEGIVIDSDYVIPGVELDGLIDGIDTHILAYNFDINNQDFLNVVEHNRLMLEKVDDELIYKLIGVNSLVSLEDYEKFIYDKRKGGWKALQYLMALGIIGSVEDCFTLMKSVNRSHADVPFLGVEAIIKAIHEAGGIAILAHPGKTFPKEKLEYYLDKMVEYGIDGIECYYPKHPQAETEYFLKFARMNNLRITCGCDCHGSFQKTTIGELKVEIDLSELKGIIK